MAESLGCDIDFIDSKSRWQDLNKSPLGNIASWITNARYFAERYPNHNVLLVDNLHFTPVIMNWLFVRNKRHLVVHLGSHTLYFLYSRKFSRINGWLHRLILKYYDAVICEGKMAKQLTQSILGKSLPPLYVTFLGSPVEKLTLLKNLVVDLKSSTILIVANGPTRFRLHYKGLDIMINSFLRAVGHYPELNLVILGSWSEDLKRELLLTAGTAANRVHFKGPVEDVSPYIATSALCLHCTRGDAFPTSTLEAMTAGLPVIVSDWTGTKEVVEQVDARLIVSMDEKLIADKILWYFNQPIGYKKWLALKFKEVATNYTEPLAIRHYRDTFKVILKDLGVISK